MSSPIYAYFKGELVFSGMLDWNSQHTNYEEDALPMELLVTRLAGVNTLASQGQEPSNIG